LDLKIQETYSSETSETFNGLHGGIYQKTELFITPNPAPRKKGYATVQVMLTFGNRINFFTCRDSSEDIATRLLAGRPTGQSSIPGRVKRFLSTPHPAFYPMGNGGSFPRVKAEGA
jgi:hypothetical protein